MQGPGTKCGLSIGFDAFLLSFLTNRKLLLRVSLCLCPPGQNAGISNTAWHNRALAARVASPVNTLIERTLGFSAIHWLVLKVSAKYH